MYSKWTYFVKMTHFIEWAVGCSICVLRPQLAGYYKSTHNKDHMNFLKFSTNSYIFTDLQRVFSSIEFFLPWKSLCAYYQSNELSIESLNKY